MINCSREEGVTFEAKELRSMPTNAHNLKTYCSVLLGLRVNTNSQVAC